jgi:imidazolonepropionase-like amidohydrolase
MAASEAVPDSPTLALTDAWIRTQTEAGEFVGTVVVRDGKIVALGPNVQAPAGAKVVNASKCVITPGLIDSRSRLGLNAAAASESGREATLDILDAVDPFAADWRDAARQGVTAVYVQPAGSGTLGGNGAVLRVGPGESAGELVVKSPAAIQAALGLAPQAPAPAAPTLPEGFGRRGPPITLPTQPPAPPPASTTLTRHAQYEQLRSQFEAAKQYSESKPARPEQPKELLVRSIRREIPVRIEIHHEDDIRNALKLAADFGLRPIFERVERAHLLPPELLSSRADVVVGPFATGKPSAEVRKLVLQNRQFAIGTFGDDARDTAGLRFHAAAAVAAGYPRDRVLAAMTSDAADILGVGDRLGRLAVGRTADLVVFAGDPLDPSAPVRLTISQGRITHESNDAESAPLPLLTKPDLPAKLPPSFVLKTTRLQTPSGEFAPGELHIVSGRLSAGSASGSPSTVFDVGDAPVTPGFLSASLVVAGESSPDADAAHLRAADGIAPDDSRLRSCRDAGFLTAILTPSSENVIAGIATAVRADGKNGGPEIGLKFVLSTAARSRERYPVSLAGEVELIAARLRGEPQFSNLYLPATLQANLQAQRDQTLNAVRGRQLAACFEAQTRAEIRAALRLIQEHNLRGVLLLPREVEDLADEIRQAGAAIVIAPVRPRDAERSTRGLVALERARVPLAFGGEPSEARQSAAWLVSAGLSRASARKALTGQPAEALGLPASTGRLLPGDAADFVIWTGDPLDTTSRPAAVIAQGQLLAGAARDTGADAGGNRPAAAPTRGRGRGRE